MTAQELKERILQLKKEKDVCILAHSYQSHDILEIADASGDSFALSRRAQTLPQSTVLMCGVRFMAETVKMLSPEKRVILSHADAGCPMAEQMTPDTVRQMKRQFGDIPVVAYINTTAELKTVCDVCVTSSSALRIVSRMPQKELIFIPDINLGTYVASRLPEKTIHLFHGGCPIHARLTLADVQHARASHPGALLLVHPECIPEVTREADLVGSTADIIRFARESTTATDFIIGTEAHIVEHLTHDCPEKRFYPLSPECVCENMALTTLEGVLACLEGTAGTDIILSPEVQTNAVRCIQEMLRLGG